ncbi:DUF7504 family protein [Halopelagius longus]|uniref:Recombinase RecA n=1 Tax=Halopelagius longus TaxID=1236180 RepID=A0A1H1E9C3_9EURY|nr:hypothetical protein [Halopelagius longus]RDI71663.1 hypothetical protein DWB78_07945 [Halopelagius longus]SDQ85362.1 hypothetical protein SAMN05216278_2798 [Halopelagius longus]
MDLSERVPDVPRTATSVLVLRSAGDAPSDRAYGRLLVEDASGVRVAGVSFSGTPDRWLDGWEETLGGPPAAAALVTGTDAASRASDSGVTVYGVPSPADLTGIGMKLSSRLTDWEAADGEVVVAVESLTLLLQYSRLETLYRFLHVLTGRLAAVGARGQFFLDPTAHDEMTVNTLKTLFDAVVERRDDEWRVDSR